MLQKDYYRGAAAFDPASADLARKFLDLSQKDELRQLIAELKYPGLEQMESILDESEQDIDTSEQSG